MVAGPTHTFVDGIDWIAYSFCFLCQPFNTIARKVSSDYASLSPTSTPIWIIWNMRSNFPIFISIHFIPKYNFPAPYLDPHDAMMFPSTDPLSVVMVSRHFRKNLNRKIQQFPYISQRLGSLGTISIGFSPWRHASFIWVDYSNNPSCIRWINIDQWMV